MRNILPKELKIKFLERLNELEGFNYGEGNPFLADINNKPYYVFLKNISPAFFKHSPDVTRVQLPSSKHFTDIAKADISFVILGYDVDNDTMVSWNPQKVRDRLNAKSNVSLYSRASLQSNVTEEFKEAYLSNGEKIILFKRDSLIHFFDKLDMLFVDTPSNSKKKSSSESSKTFSLPTLTEITDRDLLDVIEPLLQKNQVLKSVEICKEYYENKPLNMNFKNCFELVKALYNKIKDDV